jgi:hypothetical protein
MLQSENVLEESCSLSWASTGESPGMIQEKTHAQLELALWTPHVHCEQCCGVTMSVVIGVTGLAYAQQSARL